MADAIEFPRTSAQVSTLPNGLEVIVKEDHSAPVVSLQVWCRSGSIHEGDWLGAGLSHFLEHMLFKGTRRRDSTEIARTVQAAGGYINAYTSFDRTVYWIDSTADGYETCLDVLCDVVADSQLPEEEFEKEADVIRREFAMGDDNPDQVLSKLMFRAAFSEHPCRHPVIGHLDLFNQLTRDRLADYYREHYSPDNLFIVVAGDVDADRTRELIEKHLGGLTRRQRNHPVIPPEPRQLGSRKIREEFPTELSRSELVWPVPGLTDPLMPAFDLLATIAGSGKSSRLYREVREKQGLAHSVTAYSYTPAQSGLFIVSLDTEPEKRDAAEAAAIGCLQEISENGVSDAELGKATRQSLAAQLKTLTTMRGQASDLGSNWILTRNLDFTRDYVDSIQKVVPDDITGAVREYLTGDNLTTVSLDPPGNGKEERKKKSSGAGRSDDIRKIVLSNDLTVLLLADRRIPMIYTHATFRGGMMAASPETAGICRLMSRLLTKDTWRHTAEEIGERIESVGGSIGSSDGRNTVSVSSRVLRPDLKLAIELSAECLSEPAFHEEVVDREKKFQIASIKAEDDRPFNVAMLKLREEIFGSEHPLGLRASGTEKTVSSFNADALEALRCHLLCGKNGVIGVFGDIDIAQTEDLISKHLEYTIPAGEQSFADPAALTLPDSEAREVEIHHDKEQAILLIGFRTGALDDPRRPALDLLNESCSDMASRVFIRIREDLGLAYSVGATEMLGLHTGCFIFYVATAPDKLDEVQRELIDEIEALRTEGLSSKELERARCSYLGSEIMSLQSAASLASTTVVDELLGLGWDNYRQTPDIIRGLATDEIRDTAAEVFAPEKRVIVRLTNPG